MVIINVSGIADIVIRDNKVSVSLAVNIALSRTKLILIKKLKRKQQNMPTYKPKNSIKALKL